MGALLNALTHLHVIVLDGLCEHDVAWGVRFQGALGLGGKALGEVRQRIRNKRACHAPARGLLVTHETEQMLVWAQSGGFSLDASVLILARYLCVHR